MERILVLGLSSDHGGIENFILNVYEHIDRNELQFDFLIKDKLCGDFKARIEKLGGKIYVIGTFKRNAIGVWNRLNALYKANRYEKVYVNMSYAPALIYVIPALKNGLKKIYLHSHASDDVRKIPHYFFRFVFYSFFLKKIECVYMGCSENACMWQFGEHIYRNNKMTIINNAIEYNRFKFDADKRRVIRKKFCIPKEALVLGHVGRFSDEKNHRFLLELFEKLIEENSNIYMLLVGNGALKEQIRFQAITDNVVDNIIFVGTVADTAQYYNAMDCFLLPSVYEGLPLSVVEAQVNGLKCGISDKVTDKVNILGKCQFMDISTTDSFEKYIKEFDREYDRNVEQDSLIAAGFDLQNEVKKIQQLLID